MRPTKLCLAGMLTLCLSCQASRDKGVTGSHLSGGVWADPGGGVEPISEDDTSSDDGFILPMGEELTTEPIGGNTGATREIVTDRTYTGQGTRTLVFRNEPFPGGLSAGFLTLVPPFEGEENCLVSGWYAGDPGNQGWVKGVTYNNGQCIMWSHVDHLPDISPQEFDQGGYGTFWVPVYSTTE